MNEVNKTHVTRQMKEILASHSEDFEELCRLAELELSEDFKNADLVGVDFGKMDLATADFSGADLRDANLSEVIGLTWEQLRDANTEGASLPKNMEKKSLPPRAFARDTHESSLSLVDKRVFVAGHNGMVGSAICRALADKRCEILQANRSTLDLTDREQVNDWFAEHRPQVVFLAAARVGGILANDTHPVEFLQDNLKIETSVIEAAHLANVEKLVFLGSSCIYPKFAEQPIVEDSLLTGALEPTNEWYAIAKIAGIKLCQAYRKQHGADFISAMPCNLYGVNDNFDLNNSHVIPALIRKAHEAKEKGTGMVVWGSGKPRREFLYADDAADAVVHLAQHYSGYEHVNVGTGHDVTIAELTETISDVVGFEGEITFDTSKPDGVPRKLLDVNRLTEAGWRSRVSLREGLVASYAWYLENEVRFR